MEKNYIINSEQYIALKQAWKRLAELKSIMPHDIIIYNLLRGKALRNGFVPVTNPSKIQGLDEWFSYNRACFDAGWKLPDRRPECVASTKLALRDAFKARYGIDAFDGLYDALQEARK